jgi:flavin-binding protein dodecin
MTVSNVAKVIELVGESPRSWQEAVESAVREASKTVHNITGVEVTNWTANVSQGKIQEYKVDVKVAFAVDADRA